jgi:cytidylate kinase
MSQNVITIDGPAASGKSSLSRSLARKLQWKWVSTGAFYRALGLMAHKKNVDQQSEDDLIKLLSDFELKVLPDPVQTQVYIDGVMCSFEEIYSVDNGTRASNVSKFPKIRAAVLDLQRNCYLAPGLIAEGRDCGTVIFPDAQLKIYLVANVEARASRRSEEYEDGKSVKDVEKALKARDDQDSSRKAAPMEAAKDAWVLDSSNLSLEEVSDLVYEKASKVFLT